MTGKTVHEPVIVERDGATVQLVLNRPEAGNALDVPMARALLRAAIECDEDEGVRCVVITGSGSMFCAGGDISGFASVGDAVGVHIKEITSYFHAAVTRLMRMAKPVVTAVNGPAAGAGMSLAIAGDIVLAATSAHFTVAYGKLGYTPDGAMTWTLPRLVGLRRAQELTITNRRVNAGEALAIGLVTQLVEGDAFAQTVASVATDLAISATGAIGRTKALLQSSFGSTLETQLEYEAQAIAASARTPHGREGVTAFTSKRKPDFSGSGIENV